MSVPMCPVHNSPMKSGRGGGFFCPKKNGDQWCDQKVSAAVANAPQSTGPVPAFPQASGPTTTPKHLLVLGALDFAAKVFQGTGNSDDALALANAVFADWKDAL